MLELISDSCTQRLAERPRQYQLAKRRSYNERNIIMSRPSTKVNTNVKPDDLSFTNSESQTFWVLFHQTYHYISRARENELKSSHITITQRHLLSALAYLGGKATVNELVIRHHSDYHNVAALVKRMAETGLISRSQSPDGEHFINVELTKKGKKLWESTDKSDAIDNILSVLPKKELDRIISLLIKLRDSSLQKLVTQEASRRFKLNQP